MISYDIFLKSEGKEEQEKGGGDDVFLIESRAK